MARGKSGSATCTFAAKFIARGSSEQMDLATAASTEEPPLIDDASIAMRAQKRRRASFRRHSSPPKRTKHEHSPTELSIAPRETPIEEPAPALDTTQQNGAHEENVVDVQDESENVQDGQSHGEAQKEITEGRMADTTTNAIPHADGTIDQEMFDIGNGSEIQVEQEIEHTVDQAQETPTPTIQVAAAPTVTSSSPQFSNPDGYLMKQVISTLDRSAEDMLDCFLDLSIDDMHQLVEHMDTYASRVWSTLLDLFDPYRRIYSHDEHYIKPSDFAGFPSSSYTSMYKANLASAICTLLNPTPANLAQLHTHFLEIFVRPEGRMVEWQSVVLHELKTQLCIARIQENTLPIYSTLNDIFPGNIEQIFRQQGLGFNGPHLSPTEITFLNQCSQTRQRFLGAGSLEAIGRAYPWREFLQAIARHMVPHVEIVLGRTPQRDKSVNPPSNPLQSTRGAKMSTSQNNEENFGTDDDDPYNDDEILRSATLAAHAAMGGQGFSTSTYEANRDSQENAGKRDQNPESPFSQELASQAANSTTLQHTSTQEQYEKARLAATARAAAKAKGNAGNQSHRRPWTPEEENALMRGLDEVKGPHWSQILLMYGPGGRISEILKDRNQVQLKDKARNLKLFFLKSGREVPASLKEVTGELKTRAPQAAKNEAMKDADGTEEDVANGDAAIENDLEAVREPSASPELTTPAPEDNTQPIQDGSPIKPPEEDESMADAIQQAMQAVNATNALQTAS